MLLQISYKGRRQAAGGRRQAIGDSLG